MPAADADAEQQELNKVRAVIARYNMIAGGRQRVEHAPHGARSFELHVTVLRRCRVMLVCSDEGCSFALRGCKWTGQLGERCARMRARLRQRAVMHILAMPPLVELSSEVTVTALASSPSLFPSPSPSPSPQSSSRPQPPL
jgi:hypothetical protein